MAGVPTFSVVTPPAPIVALADARLYPGIPAAAVAPDLLVQQQLDAAQGFLEGPDGWLNRSLGLQTLQCSITPGMGFRRPEPIILAGGPVLSVVSVTGLAGSDSYGFPPYLLEGDALTLFGSIYPTFNGPPTPVVVQYTAGSPPNVIAQVKPVIMAMAAKMLAAATTSGRDPSLRSENIPDTFSKSWDTSAAGASAAAYGMNTLAPIMHLQKMS